MNYYGMQGPAQYAQFQQSRQDQQLQNMLRLMMQMRAMKQDKSQWEREAAQKQERLELDKQKLESIDRYRKYLEQPKPQTPSSAMKTIEYMVESNIAPNRFEAFRMYKGFKDPERIKLEAQMRAEGKAAGTPATATKPTSFEQREARISAKVKSGEITQQQADQALLSIKPLKTEKEQRKEGYVTRDSNLKFVSKTIGDVAQGNIKTLAEKARKQIKDVPDATPTIDGVRLDMPTHYSVAKMNIDDGVDIPEDREVITKYDKLFQRFIGEILPDFKNYKQFREYNPTIPKDSTLPNPGECMKQIKLWFEIYK